MGKRASRRAAARARVAALPVIEGAATNLPARPRAHAVGMTTTYGTSYTGAGNEGPLINWDVGTTEPNSAWTGQARTITDRARDLVANDEQAATAIERLVAMQVGVDFRFSPQHELMAQRLGIDVEKASILADEIEQAFESWSNDRLNRGDWEEKQSFGQQVNLAGRHLAIDGDAFALLRWDSGPLRNGWKWRTSLHVIDPDRVASPLGYSINPNIVNGIETDGRRPVAVHIREAHPADVREWGRAMNFERVPMCEPWGRPIVIHAHARKRAGEQRGLSRFLPTLFAFCQMRGYKITEVSAAKLNAMFGAHITTAKTPAEATDALGVDNIIAAATAREEIYKGHEPRLPDGSRIPVLAPGDEFNLNAVPRHVASFEGFVRTMGRGIAAALGVSGSEFLGDFTSMSFSTWRGEFLPIWQRVLQDRALIASQFCDRVLLAVIEEGIDNGMINPPEGCPDLYACTHGWLAGQWIGPSRGSIDPGGEVDAANKRVAGGYSSIERETLELGTTADYRGNAGQVGYERDVWNKQGLKPTAIRELEGEPKPGAAAPTPPQPENKAAGNVVEPPKESPSSAGNGQDGDTAPADAGAK
jgi:lambda family phage portal protein